MNTRSELAKTMVPKNSLAMGLISFWGFHFLEHTLDIFLVVNLLCFLFLGIFAYINFMEPKTRAQILEILVNGLKRLEYRGYDSAGISMHNC